MANSTRRSFLLFRRLASPYPWRMLWFCRVPLLFALFLGCLGPFGLLLNPSMLGNGFLLSNAQQVGALTLMSLFFATLLFVQLDVIRRHGLQRFDDLADLRIGIYVRRLATETGQKASRFWNWSPLRTILWLFCALSLPATCCLHSVSQAGGDYIDDPSLTTPQGIAGLVLGGLEYLFLLQCVALLDSLIDPSFATVPSPLPMPPLITISLTTRGRTLLKRLQRSAWCSGPGYSTIPDAAFAFPTPLRGHRALQISFIALVIAYASIYWFMSNSEIAPDDIFTTPFYLTFSLTFWSLVISAAAYFLDYYRISVLVLVIVALIVYNKLSDFDHRFPVLRLAEEVASNDNSSLAPVGRLKVDRDCECVGDDSENGKPPGETVLVVVAPGGGIHASAWTGQVLSGLHDRYRVTFEQSLRLISAVSGGSVGSMYYLDNFSGLVVANGGKYPGELKGEAAAEFRETIKAVFRRSSTSSLEALAWGATFPDSLRLLFDKLITEDRGAVQERRWLGRMGETNEAYGHTMRDWRDKAVRGDLPFVVFNATEAETGRRILFSTVALPPDLSIPADARPIDFFTAANMQFDLPIATAVRLSATFPYASAAAMPAKGTLPFGHVVDGGYVDNDGVLTAVELIRRWIAHPIGGQHVERIVVIRIAHTPPLSASVVRSTDPGLGGTGWEYATVGPLVAMGNVRSTSQQERGEVELELLRRSAAQYAKAFKHPCITVEPITIQFQRVSGYDAPPLNWKLSPKQRDAYGTSWLQLTDAADKVRELPPRKQWKENDKPLEGLQRLDVIMDDLAESMKKRKVAAGP